MNKRIVAGLAGLAIIPVIVLAQGEPVKEIALERTPCFGACPVYKVTLKPDGTVIYDGKKFVEKIGRYEAKVTPEEIKQLSTVVNSLGFWKMKDKYTAQITDLPSALVTVHQGDKVKTTDNYGGLGPAELWAIEQLIDKVVLNAHEWKKVE